MKVCTAILKSVSPYSQSRSYSREIEKLEKEAADDYERRTWRNKCHADADGIIFVPGMSFKMALDAAAKFLSIRISGKRNATYTKHFLAGVLVFDDVPLGVKKDNAHGEWVFANADGVRGSGKRVWRCFPVIPAWDAKVVFHIGDDTVTKSVFTNHLTEAGKFVGIGRFRPEKGGRYGRFEVVSTAWS